MDRNTFGKQMGSRCYNKLDFGKFSETNCRKTMRSDKKFKLSKTGQLSIFSDTKKATSF